MINYINPLQVVLERLAYADSEKGAFFFWDEVKDWPSSTLDILVSSGFLQPAQPMDTVVCDGCEENCIMPVVIYPAGGNKPGRAFITCDKRDDMGRIKVSFDRMRQWQVTGELIAAALVRLLGLSLPSTQPAAGGQWHIGVLKGRKHRNRVTLLAGGGLTISLTGHAVPLIEVLAIKENALRLDKSELIRLVDKPVGDAQAENPEVRRARLKARVGEEKAKGTKAFLRTVAEEEGISSSRLKQLIGNNHAEADALKNSSWSGLLITTKQTSSKKSRSKY